MRNRISGPQADFDASSLADLYDPTLMPKELLQAHRQNDRGSSLFVS